MQFYLVWIVLSFRDSTVGFSLCTVRLYCGRFKSLLGLYWDDGTLIIELLYQRFIITG